MELKQRQAAVEYAAARAREASERLALVVFNDLMAAAWPRFTQQDDPHKRLVPAVDARSVVITGPGLISPVEAGSHLAKRLSAALAGADGAFLIWRIKPRFTGDAAGLISSQLSVVISDSIGRTREASE